MEFKKLVDELFGSETFDWVNNIVRKTVKHSEFRGSHQDDLQAEAFLALSECKKKYNPDTGVPFKAFAYPRVRGAMVDYLRREFRSGIMQQVTFDSLPCEGESQCRGLDETFALKQTGSILVRFIQQLPVESQNLLRKRYLEDMPFEAVSDLSRSAAFKRHQKVLLCLKEQFAASHVNSYQEAA